MATKKSVKKSFPRTATVGTFQAVRDRQCLYGISAHYSIFNVYSDGSGKELVAYATAKSELCVDGRHYTVSFTHDFAKISYTSEHITDLTSLLNIITLRY